MNGVEFTTRLETYVSPIAEEDNVQAYPIFKHNYHAARTARTGNDNVWYIADFMRKVYDFVCIPLVKSERTCEIIWPKEWQKFEYAEYGYWIQYIAYGNSSAATANGCIDGIAVLTGEKSGIFCIDVDLKAKTGETEEETQSRRKITMKWVYDMRLHTSSYIERTKSGGYHYFFNYIPKLKSNKGFSQIIKDNPDLSFLRGIDMLSDGCQATIAPSFGVYYQIVQLFSADGTTYIDVPVLPPEESDKFSELYNCEYPMSVPLDCNLDDAWNCAHDEINLEYHKHFTKMYVLPIDDAPPQLVEFLFDTQEKMRTPDAAEFEYIPVNQYETNANEISEMLDIISQDDYTTWINVGMALKRGGCDFELFNNWSRKSAKYDEVNCRKQWDRIKADGTISIGTLFHIARETSADKFSEIKKKYSTKKVTKISPKLLEDAKNNPELRALLKMVQSVGDNSETSIAIEFVERIKKICVCVDVEKSLFYYYNANTKIWESCGINYMRDVFIETFNDKLHIKNYNKKTIQESVIKLVGRKLSIIDFENTFNRKANLIPFNGSVVDLRSGEVRERTPEDLFTFSINCDYNPNINTNRIETFMREIFNGNKSLYRYMHRALGYGITGETKEREFFILFGAAANGKSLLFNMISDLFTTNSKTFKIFLKGNNNAIIGRENKQGPNEDVMGYENSRMLLFGEASGQYNESIIKSITGGDELQCRGIYEKNRTIKPRCKLFITTNDVPKIDMSIAIVDRLRVIHMKSRYVDKPDPDNKHHHLRDRNKIDEMLKEREALFYWLVQGAIEYYKYGFGKTPLTVLNASKSALSNADYMEEFMAQYVKTTNRADSIQKNLIINDHEKYCTDNKVTNRKMACDIITAFVHLYGNTTLLRGIKVFRYIKLAKGLERYGNGDIHKDINEEVEENGKEEEYTLNSDDETDDIIDVGEDENI